MRKPLLALATLPIAAALATIGAGTASATSAGSESALGTMANCSAIGVQSDRATGTCYDTAFRVGVRCGPESGSTWQIFYSLWMNKGETGVASCPATWVASTADYDLPD
ncbi:hypothetical protein [Amycolatopsis pittospori]|uniref:hypothetical protein n=1 Tax=Amycolatopsis pittospori TaxID=2749434 RepID=UPI0015F02BF5|nr:hypothetical protein [Amycolatopsis pittospori]